MVRNTKGEETMSKCPICNKIKESPKYDYCLSCETLLTEQELKRSKSGDTVWNKIVRIFYYICALLIVITGVITARIVYLQYRDIIDRSQLILIVIISVIVSIIIAFLFLAIGMIILDVAKNFGNMDESLSDIKNDISEIQAEIKNNKPK